MEARTPRFAGDQNGYQTETGFQSQSDSLSRLLDQLFGLLRRQYLLIISVALLAVAIGAVYLLTTPPVYTSHAKVLIDTNKTRALQQQTGPIIYFQTMDIPSIMTQVELLKSDGTATAVVKAQHLADDPAFVGGAEPGIFGKVAETLFGKTGKLPDTRSETERTRAAVGKVMAQRSVTRVADTYVLDIGYSAASPEMAAKLANAIANAYIDEQLDSKYQIAQRANTWLQERIKDLRAQAAAADRAIFDYKEKNKIVDVSGGTSSGRLLDDDQVIQLNSQLITARISAAEAKARLDRITEIMTQDVPDAATADTLQSSIIGTLRSQYLELDRRARIFSERYGATHLAVVNLHTQMAELRRSISDELRRIAQSYKSDYEIAKARVQTMEKSLAGVISNAQSLYRDRIGLTDLETTAKIYHSMYDNFLNRYMEASQQQSLPITEARVISDAQPGYQSAPNSHNVLASSIFLGLVFGFGISLLREAVDRVFRTRSQVESTLRTNCLAVLPRLVAPSSTIRSVNKAQPAPMSDRQLVPDPTRCFSSVIEDPHSLFAEGIRSIKVAADIASAIKENKVIGITSSVPREGKSTIASNLAELMAHGGKRVALIDGDLRNLTLSRNLTADAKVGLLEVLAQQADLNGAIYTDSRSGLKFLPAIVDSRLAHTDEILASKGFRNLLDVLRSEYDYIIVDLPPLAPVSDARATAGIIDSYIYIVEWGRTRSNVVQHQLAAAPELWERVLGVVLSKANYRVLTRYEQYYGSNYYKYYNARYGYVPH